MSSPQIFPHNCVVLNGSTLVLPSLKIILKNIIQKRRRHQLTQKGKTCVFEGVRELEYSKKRFVKILAFYTTVSYCQTSR